MTTDFPTSLDTLTNPTTTDTLTTVPHADQHANANDAIEALQAKVGVDGSAVATSLDKRVTDLEATGTGDVVGPASSTDNDIATFDLATGKLIQDSGVNISDVTSNTSARHDAVTVTDTAEIDLTLTGQDIQASIKSASIDESKLDVSVNASLDLADSSVQTETDPVVGAVTGIVKADGAGNISAASAGTDYQAPLVADTDYLTPGTASSTYEPLKGGDDNYVTDAQLVVIGNTSNTNTGDEVEASGAELDTGTDQTKYASAKAIKDAHNVPSVAPGTSGNVLVSDGTDWTSAVPAGGGDMTAATYDADAVGGNIYINNAMSRQAIINGNFDVWQRGTSFTNPSSASFTADRVSVPWGVDGGTAPTSIVHSRNQLTSGELDGSFFSYRVAPNGAGSGYGVSSVYYIHNKIENGVRSLCGDGKTVTFSFWAKSDIAGKRIGINLAQNYGSGGSPTTQETITGEIIELTSTLTKYTATFTTNTLVSKTFGTAFDDYLSVRIFYQWGTAIATSQFGGGTAEDWGGSGNIDIAQVQLCAGDVALPFMPKSFEEELRACQRYYEKSFNYNITPTDQTYPGLQTSGTAYSTSVIRPAAILFKTTKRVAPSISFYSDDNSSVNTYWSYYDGGWNNGVNTGVTDIKDTGFSLNVNSSGSFTVGNSYMVTGHWTADAEL